MLAISFLLLRGLGWLGVNCLKSWREVGCIALAILFLFTGATHFFDIKHDYAAMIPSPFPKSLWLIYLTGILQVAGAIGLLLPRIRKIAGLCLIALLVALFPANVNAALNNVPFRGQPPTSLWLRALIQLVFVAMIWWSSIKDRTWKEIDE
ncbi:MAG TPA: DoxX family protein [Pyrinomonadaceae bacterium]|nr:DoxX family protein [Pyrinomonadaceae bacterium]